MKLEFLGDAFDYWKGALFSRLQREGILVDFVVDPMLTDPENWRTSGFRLYADLLQITEDHILPHKRKLQEERPQYFAEITHTGDLFLDPDTGISLGYARHPERYIRVKEVYRLLGDKSSKILCIYQHIGREKTRDRVSKLITALGGFGTGIYCCSYETRTVAMLFISQKQNRIEQVNKCFKDYLGRHSGMRVYCTR
jgi:hypothetical protein